MHRHRRDDLYSPIVRNQIVGNTYAPLLRVVPIKQMNQGGNIIEEFKHPRYLSTTDKSTDVISVDIRRGDGTEVSFMTGKVHLTLHFRKRKCLCHLTSMRHLRHTDLTMKIKLDEGSLFFAGLPCKEVEG